MPLIFWFRCCRRWWDVANYAGIVWFWWFLGACSRWHCSGRTTILTTKITHPTEITPYENNSLWKNLLIEITPHWNNSPRIKPGDLVSREIWHSPVIQATWKARTVGWLEAERSLPPGEGFLWPHYGRHAGRRSTEEVKLLWREEADCMQQQQQVQAATSSRPSEEIPNSARLSSQYCNCKIVKTPRNNQLKKRIKIFDLSTMIVQGAV